jgi:dihydroorotate dehydrogenase
VYQSLLRPIAFKLDPEWVHERALALLERGLIRANEVKDARLHQQFFGSTFENPLGLAAGFDKNAVALDQWHRLGFGYAEIGTVTYHPQPGNDKPRMFRVPEDKGLINRLGFNNRGAEALARRLAVSNPKLPYGINLGKSKVTELADAPMDYQKSFRLLHTFGDYFVVNVSSPNTPGLRTLQDKGALQEILAAMLEVDAKRPIFVKVAPDLELTALDDVLEVATASKLAGLIATNTTISREGLTHDPQQTGGLSGAPLKAKADAVLKHLYQACPTDLILIGVGGIMSGDDLYDKIAYGAHLAQVYTGWIYGGPSFAGDCLRGLVSRMASEGITLAELRGSKARLAG